MKFESDNYPEEDIQVQYTKDQIRVMEDRLDNLCATIEKGKFCCASCNCQLPGDHADIYDHEGGWSLAKDVTRQWVSFRCKCGYDTSLNKMQHGLNHLLYKESF